MSSFIAKIGTMIFFIAQLDSCMTSRSTVMIIFAAVVCMAPSLQRAAARQLQGQQLHRCLDRGLFHREVRIVTSLSMVFLIVMASIAMSFIVPSATMQLHRCSEGAVVRVSRCLPTRRMQRASEETQLRIGSFSAQADPLAYPQDAARNDASDTKDTYLPAGCSRIRGPQHLRIFQLLGPPTRRMQRPCPVRLAYP